MSFIAVRWDHYRQSEYAFSNGTVSEGFTTNQFLVPIGIRVAWNGKSTENRSIRT